MADPGATAGASPPEGARTAPRRLFADRAGVWLFRAGGVAVVASLIGILVFLVAEVVPLFGDATVEPVAAVDAEGPATRALLVDPHRTHVAALGSDGRVRVFRLPEGALALEADVFGGPVHAARAVRDENAFTIRAADGRVGRVELSFDLTYEGRQRVVTARVGEPEWFEAAAVGAHVLRTDSGTTTLAYVHAEGGVEVVRIAVEENDFTGERTETQEAWRSPVVDAPTALAMDRDQRVLFGANAAGELLVWDLVSDGPRRSDPVGTGRQVRDLALMVGGRGLVVGFADGGTDVWFRVSRGRAGVELVRAHVFAAPADASAPVAHVVPSGRGRSFLLVRDDGTAALQHSTSGRVLWRGQLGSTPQAAALTPKGDGAYVAGPGTIAAFTVDNPHPEAGLRSFFARIWYEDYPKPEYVWQSTGGTDEFEPKLSLTPLLVGTFKGTVYALFLAIPLGILGALYTSQFLDPVYQRIVKPVVELMASLPSVVLGFLAGLWLAPRLEVVFPGLILMAVGLPLLSLGAGAIWSALPRRYTGRLPAGTEIGWYALVLLAGMAGCIWLSPDVEGLVFGGDFSEWLTSATGLQYDQRNAIVAGIAMGFAVIPIIFAISEDSLTNVPRTLVAASLAVGATRWQTMARVVLPAASPGLFAAVMIGFGRAVGETMIVLMATGNTPLLDWNAFNGFRTLSANIAVEIPEAPHGATLYRTLFISALLLFAITFMLNTAAELVRERLRKQYSGA